MDEAKKPSGGKIRFHCPHCAAKVVIGYRSAGKNATCPECGKPVIIPFEMDPSVVLAPRRSGGGKIPILLSHTKKNIGEGCVHRAVDIGGRAGLLFRGHQDI